MVEEESSPEEVVEPQGRQFREASVGLDTWSLEEFVSKQAAVMKNVPRFLKGPKHVCKQRWKKPRLQKGVKNEDGNCLSCCPDCCFTDLPGEVED